MRSREGGAAPRFVGLHPIHTVGKGSPPRQVEDLDHEVSPGPVIRMCNGQSPGIKEKRIPLGTSSEPRARRYFQGPPQVEWKVAGVRGDGSI